eukprot:scaffold5994_cov54-Phaeocystis_antarctica.AAC.3
MTRVRQRTWALLERTCIWMTTIRVCVSIQWPRFSTHHVLHHTTRHSRPGGRVALLYDIMAVRGVACAEEVGLPTIGDGGLGVPAASWG